MKRISICLMAVLLIVAAFAGCGASNTESGGPKRPSIVVTIFPQYDWVREILGENIDRFDLTLLLDSGVDLHSFQPTAADIATISTCDMFIYVGGESDEWVHDALETATNKDMVIINLLEVLGGLAKTEELKEGMEPEEEHDHAVEEEHEEGEHPEEEHAEGEEEEHGEALDEHVWLSLRNAQLFCTFIAEELGRLDVENAVMYAANAQAYNGRLSELDTQYASAVSGGSCDTLLFGDRFPFRYLVDDYGLDYFAAFVGCSAETEASFETIAFLANKTDELELANVMALESSDQSIAKTIVENTLEKNQRILVMDAIQSVTGARIANGETYLSIMEGNLAVLKEALQ